MLIRKFGSWGLLLLALNELRGLAVVASILGAIPGTASGHTAKIEPLQALMSCAVMGAHCGRVAQVLG